MFYLKKMNFFNGIFNASFQLSKVYVRKLFI